MAALLTSLGISIHAPREGGDAITLSIVFLILGFQSTPPARGATIRNVSGEAIDVFQSTPPARGATTGSSSPSSSARVNFNPRPPRGGRPCRIQTETLASIISIHAPREGGDCCTVHALQGFHISIHAPREGGDCIILTSSTRPTISIHAPREGGDAASVDLTAGKAGFQSTPPARGATRHTRPQWQQRLISIHAPREGGDSKDAQFYL